MSVGDQESHEKEKWRIQKDRIMLKTILSSLKQIIGIFAILLACSLGHSRIRKGAQRRFVNMMHATSQCHEQLDESLKSRTNCMGTRRNNAPIGNIAEKKSKGFEKPKKRITANTFPTEASDACNHAKGKKNVKGIRTERKEPR